MTSGLGNSANDQVGTVLVGLDTGSSFNHIVRIQTFTIGLWIVAGR